LADAGVWQAESRFVVDHPTFESDSWTLRGRRWTSGLRIVVSGKQQKADEHRQRKRGSTEPHRFLSAECARPILIWRRCRQALRPALFRGVFRSRQFSSALPDLRLPRAEV